MTRETQLVLHRIRLALALLGVLLVVGTAGYRIIVGGTLLECFYMTFITLTSVGYGEVLPGLDHSALGRVFTMVLIAMGVGVSVFLVSTLTAFLVEGEILDMLRRRTMDKAIAKLSGHVVVCGAGTTGMHVVSELIAVGEPLVVMDLDPDKLQRAIGYSNVPTVVGDAADDESLRRAGVERAAAVVVCLGSDKDNLFVTMSARQMNEHARIVARGVDLAMRERLIKAGASAVVFPNQVGGLRLVSELLRPHVVDFLDTMLRAHPTDARIWRIEEIEIPVGSFAVGKRLGELDIARRTGLPVLALTWSDARPVTYYPGPDTVLEAGCSLVVLAERYQVKQLRELIQGQGGP